MKGEMQLEKGIPVLEEIERGLRIHQNTYKLQWQSRRYDYYCGDWRSDLHEERKVEYRNGGAN